MKSDFSDKKRDDRNITDAEMTLGALLRRPYQFLSERVYTEMVANDFPDVRPAHSAVFRHIGSDGSRITELAERAQMTKQSMGALVDYLQEHGYAETVPDRTDGRAKIVCLTDKGRIIQRKAIEISREFELELSRLIGEDEMRQIRQSLERLWGTLDRLEQQQESILE